MIDCIAQPTCPLIGLGAYGATQQPVEHTTATYSVFYRIILPSLKPVTSSVIILSSVSIWKDFSFQLYFLQKPALKTVTLAISSFFSEQATNLNAGAAAALIAVLPPVILYLFMQIYYKQWIVQTNLRSCRHPVIT